MSTYLIYLFSDTFGVYSNIYIFVYKLFGINFIYNLTFTNIYYNVI